MCSAIRLITTDFDGTLVTDITNPVFDPGCMELVAKLQNDGALWAINSGRSLHLLDSALAGSVPTP
jgi:hydroxymethylpyrimidine pyrophosphatase-like HAD family hydrolase